jgi:hypothetical protein
MSILKGTIYITNREDIVYQADLRSTRIISLDEDGILKENNAIIGGTCLLPPIEAKIAEADGNEAAYDQYYSAHLLSPFQQQFVAALLSYLYRGGNLILFLPELGETSTCSKLVFHIFGLYGVHIGLIGDPNPQVANCYYNEKCVPIWLNMIYESHVITAREYLYQYPVDAIITNKKVMNDLIIEINPYGASYQDKVNYILRLHKLIHKNPNVQSAIISSEAM